MWVCGFTWLAVVGLRLGLAVLWPQVKMRPQLFWHLDGAFDHFVWLSGVPSPLGYWAGPLLGVWVGLRVMGLASCAGLMPRWPGPGGAGGLSPLVPGRPLPYGHGLSIRGLPLLSWMHDSSHASMHLSLHFFFLHFPLCLHSISTLSPLTESD